MSWEATAYVAKIKIGRNRAGRGEKLVLLCLANRYNSDIGMGWASNGALAAECGFSLRSLTYVLGRLDKAGVIERQKGNGRGNVSLYRFPGMLTEAQRADPASPWALRKAERKDASSRESAVKGAKYAPFATEKGCKNRQIKGAKTDAQRRTVSKPALLEARESFFGSLPEKAIQTPVEKAGAKATQNPVLDPQRPEKAAGGLPDRELLKLAKDLSELRLVRRADIEPEQVARCLVQAARSEVPDASAGGILAAAIEASRLPEGYAVKSPMRFLMVKVRDRFRTLALFPEGRR